jgi:hypothetical protein
MAWGARGRRGGGGQVSWELPHLQCGLVLSTHGTSHPWPAPGSRVCQCPSQRWCTHDYKGARHCCDLLGVLEAHLRGRVQHLVGIKGPCGWGETSHEAMARTHLQDETPCPPQRVSQRGTLGRRSQVFLWHNPTTAQLSPGPSRWPAAGSVCWWDNYQGPATAVWYVGSAGGCSKYVWVWDCGGSTLMCVAGRKLPGHVLDFNLNKPCSALSRGTAYPPSPLHAHHTTAVGCGV